MAELFRTLLNMSAESCWVILAVLALRLLLRRAPKSCSYALWSAVLFRLLCPVSFQSAANLFSLTGAKQEPVPAGFGSAPVFEAPAAVLAGQPQAASLPAVQGRAPGGAGAAQAAAAGGITLMQVLAVVWLLGAAALAVYGILSLVRLGSRLHWRLPDADGVYRVHGLETAFVLGVIRPRIYLPAGLPAEQERYILAHERTHLRRGDPVWRLLAFGALCLHWFNPLVWAAFFFSGRDMEMSCDEAVVRRLGPQIKKGYSASLLSLATGRRIVPGAPLAFGEGDTAPRIKNILHYKKPGFWAAALAVAVVAALCVFLAADPLAAAVPETAGQCTFMDSRGEAHTVVFALPDGWVFTPAASFEPLEEGTNGELGIITVGGQQAGKVWAGVFRSVYELDEEAQSRAMDPADTSRHAMFYDPSVTAGSTELDLAVDWDRDYTVLSATKTTEAAVTNVYVNTNAAVLSSTYGADSGQEPSWKLASRSALYFDLDESAYVWFVVSTGLAEDGSEELAALAQSIHFAETSDGMSAAALGAQGGRSLQPLYVSDLYEGGSLFDAVPADLEERLQNAIAGGLVPDRRSGQRAVALADRPWLSGGAGVVLLGEYPQKNLYVYGYYDETVGPLGLIVDAGTKQSLTAFPFRYTSGGRLTGPALYLTEDGGTLYMICETGTGTGVSIDELLIFWLTEDTVSGCAVDSGVVADAFAGRLTAKLHPASDEVRFEGEWVTFGSAEGTLLSGSLTPLGLPEGADTTPASYFCGRFLGYTVSGSTLYATCRPVMFNAAGEGFLYLEDDGEDFTLVMPVSSAADGAADLAYGSLDAWYDSVLAELDEAAHADGGCHILPAARRWQADLNHDGEKETIAFDLAALEARGVANLTVSDSGGSLLVEEQFSTSHVGWNTIGLYHDETGDYLLSYQPYFMQGMGAFNFSLFSVGADGSWQERERMEVSFSAGMPYDAPDNDVDALMEFARRATDLWSRATLLVTTDADLVLNGLYDETGRKADPGSANYYVADNALSAPLHYVETMAWTSSALDDPEAIRQAGSDLRARLEAVNRMLAAHRAEAEAQPAQSAASGKETALSAEEVAWFNTEFFNGDDGVLPAQNQFLTCEYDSPARIDLYCLLYNGAGAAPQISREEQAALEQSGMAEAGSLDVIKFTPEQADSFLMQYAAIALKDSEKAGLEQFTWLEAYNAYYHVHGDTNADLAEVTAGSRNADGTVTLQYRFRNSDRSGRVTLRPNGDGYWFKANQYD